MRYVAVALVLLATINVSEAGDEPPVWACRAESKYAYGWSRADLQEQARLLALRQCARRTPIGRTCTIKYCRQR
jgi:hypothetical protein